MKLGVTGAFGFLGASFTANVLEHRPGIGIVAFSSRTASNPLFDPARAELRHIDIGDVSGLGHAFAGLDAIAHFAGKVGYGIREKKAVWDANVVGLVNVLRAASGSGARKILYVSSVSALGPAPRGRLLNESDRPYDDLPSSWSFATRDAALDAVSRSLAGDYGFLRDSVSVYLDSKLAGLEWALENGPALGLDIVPILPGTAVGAGEVHTGIGEMVARIASGKLKVSIPGWTSFVDSRDFADGALLAFERGKPGSAYIISGPESCNLTYADFAALVGKVAASLGRPVFSGGGKPLVAPPGLALVAGSLAERFFPASGLSRGLVASGLARVVCDIGKARRELGYNPTTPIESSIGACLRERTLPIRG